MHHKILAHALWNVINVLTTLNALLGQQLYLGTPTDTSEEVAPEYTPCLPVLEPNLH